MVIKSIENKGIDELKSKITQNLRDVLTMMDWNEANGIKLFRLSSELFPHKSNPKVEDYDFDFAVDLLREIGDRSRRYNQRLTFHPGQYNVVGTPNKKCFDRSFKSSIGLTENGGLVIITSKFSATKKSPFALP
jgi:UV DNA damage endonuclease